MTADRPIMASASAAAAAAAASEAAPAAPAAAAGASRTGTAGNGPARAQAALNAGEGTAATNDGGPTAEQLLGLEQDEDYLQVGREALGLLSRSPTTTA